MPLTTAGVLGITVGALIFLMGVISNLDIFFCGLGLLFIAAGWSARQKRLCPACKMAVPKDATACGHCRRELPA